MSQLIFDKIRKQIKNIPKGFVSTYGNVAVAAGIRNPRVVGFAIYKNPHPEIIPCHRVVQKNGHLAPKFSLGGIDVQRQKLLAEGVKFSSPDIVDMNQCFFDLTSPSD